MSAIKRELERVADILLTGDLETVQEELKKLEALGMNLEHLAQVIDMAKAMAPLCECGNDYFEGIKN
jgi:hypothetical protein